MDDGWRPERPAVWPWLVFAAVLGVSVWAYTRSDQKGVSLRGDGHVLVLPGDPSAWLFTLDGAVARATPESTARFGLKTGPCERLEGYLTLDGRAIALEAATCTPGPLQRTVGERLKRASMKFGYWAKGLENRGETLEPVLQTPELYAAVIDPRVDDPQLVPLYLELWPGLFAESREAHGPPPTVIHIERNDLLIRRLTRTQLRWFLDLPVFHLAGGAVAGGWLVREVRLEPRADAPSVSKLLVNPAAPPFDSLLREGPVVVSRRPDLDPTAAAAPPPAVSPDAGLR
jgi:hypothetical protein